MSRKTSISQLETAAYDWWKSRRPKRFDFHRHLANPTVNCNKPAEKKLARALASTLKEEIARSKPYQS
jgi:hypothetical protein